MGGTLTDLGEKLGSFAGKWIAYAALGSFALYLFGYLTLRFQLSTYGVATDLDVFDEKYLFAGCRFLVYFVSAVPNILIIVLPLWAIAYLPWKLAPASFKARVKSGVVGWCNGPSRLPLLGVVLSVIFIQLVQRKCFSFGNLLLQDQPPDEWLSSVLLASDGKLSLYFSGLVAGTLLTGLIFFYALEHTAHATVSSQLWITVLGFLLAVEFLLLPVNYGVLISTQQLPRLAESNLDDKPAEGQLAWLVWDTKDTAAYFVRDTGGHGMLVSIPKKDTKIRIVAYDRIFTLLFAPKPVTPAATLGHQP